MHPVVKRKETKMEANTKQVSAVLTPPAPHMVGDGFRVHNFFPADTELK